MGEYMRVNMLMVSEDNIEFLKDLVMRVSSRGRGDLGILTGHEFLVDNRYELSLVSAVLELRHEKEVHYIGASGEWVFINMGSVD